MKKNFLEQFYTIDPTSGKYIIEISLKNYNDIFATWDSSVYNIRDLDSSLKSFLEDCVIDLGVQKKIVLRFNLKDQQKNKQIEKNIEEGIRSYFTYSLYLTNHQFIHKRKKTILYILASLLFTVPSIYFHSIEEHEIMSELILLSLTVGSWVFLWEAFSLLFIHGSDLSKKKKQYKRIIDADYKFHYAE